MITAIFEVATLADAISKAARYAPTKGSALDRSAGVVIELDPETGSAEVRATDLAVFYRQRIPMTTCKGTDRPLTWRVSSVLAQAVIGRLAMTLGANVVLAVKDEDPFLYIRSGTTRARLRLFASAHDFPRWDPFETYDMATVNGFADRLAQVQWATNSKSNSADGGVLVSGEHLYASDGYVIARVACPCPVSRPVVAPVQLALSLVRNYPEIALRATEDRLELAIDADTQMSMLLLTGSNPPSAFDRLLNLELPHRFELEREHALAAIERLLTIAEGDRYPVVEMEAQGSAIRLTLDVDEVGTIIEELVTDAEPFKLRLTPNNLRSMLEGARRSTVTISHSADPMKPIRLDDGLGYTALCLPRR